MARKITTDAINAFMSARTFNRDNTTVAIEDGNVKLYLHGHLIARRNVGSNDLEVTNADYFTATTKERLNGLPGVQVNQRKGVWYLNGCAWDGSWTNPDNHNFYGK